MDLTRRSLFGMLLVAPLAGALARLRSSSSPTPITWGVTPRGGDYAYAYFTGMGPVSEVSHVLVDGRPFVNRPSRNWAKHVIEWGKRQPSAGEWALFAKHFRPDPSQLSLF